MIERWIATQQTHHRQNVKRIYYLSLEFLIGRLLGKNVINLKLEEDCRKQVELGGSVRVTEDSAPAAPAGPDAGAPAV